MTEIWEMAGLRNGVNYPTGVARLEAIFRTTTCNTTSFRRWDNASIGPPLDCAGNSGRRALLAGNEELEEINLCQHRALKIFCYEWSILSEAFHLHHVE